MINTANENDAQKAVRRGREFGTLSADEKLAWANANPTFVKSRRGVEAPAPAKQEPVSITRPSLAQIEFLQNLVKDVDDLNEAEREHHEALGAPFHRRPSQSVNEGPALDIAKVSAEDGFRRLQIDTDFKTYKKVLAERNVDPALRAIGAEESEQVRLRIQPYLETK